MTPPLSDRIPGIVLAGGLSSRMGTDKAHVRLGGRPLAEHAAGRLRPQVCGLAINANLSSAQLEALTIPLFADAQATRSGPLGGIHAALLFARRHWPDASYVATVPTDSPFFPQDLVARLAAALDRPEQTAVAASSGGVHPVFALWPLGHADDLDEWLRQGRSLRLRDWLDGRDVRAVHFPDIDTDLGPLDPFFNINTPDDLAKAKIWLRTLDPQDT